MTETKKHRRVTRSRGQHTYFVLRRSRVDISAHILIIVILFCNFYHSLEKSSEIVPETKPRPLLCPSSTIYYSLQLGDQTLAQIVPSPQHQTNTTTPRALHRLHQLKLIVSHFLCPSLFLILLLVPSDRNMQSKKSGDSFATTRVHSLPDPRTVTDHVKIHSPDL